MPPDTRSHPRSFPRRLARAFAVLYPLAVAVLVAVQLATPVRTTSWAEMFYGPLITVVASYLFILFGWWIGGSRRREA